MLQYEDELWKQGYKWIAGIDEVGRGCLFGDVVAAAVIMPVHRSFEDINDSKKISEKKREKLYDKIMDAALGIGIGTVSAELIDEINIKQASRLAMKQAVEQLQMNPDYLLIDAERVEMDVPQLSIIHGDARSQSIAAASIIAKVTRDRMCLKWDMDFPEYGIASHKGYATKRHRENLLHAGASPMHRKSFLKNIFKEQLELF